MEGGDQLSLPSQGQAPPQVQGQPCSLSQGPTGTSLLVQPHRGKWSQLRATAGTPSEPPLRVPEVVLLSSKASS